MAADCGRILVLGDYVSVRARFAWSDLMHRQLELIGSCSGAGAWSEAVQLAVGEQVLLHRLVTHRFPAEEFNEAFMIMQERREDFIKIVLEW
ncbi:hypothetical protein HZA56_01845 [Candidatus Poribacteria bacterium]|nr:hypothetical protein [Candidatus Poribacteria bacterium]